MKKNTIKAFTLVEMLIVIVIIGILIASLMPRMQTAQGRARDVARKNDLSQIQTAIITSQQDRGSWPYIESGAKNGVAVSGDTIETILKSAGMTQIPKDPNNSNPVHGLGTGNVTGAYLYMVTNRNGVPDAGFALMAKTEVEGGSNWVVCATDCNSANKDDFSTGCIAAGSDLKNVQLCNKVTENKTSGCKNDSGTCTYSETSQLRYLLVY